MNVLIVRGKLAKILLLISLLTLWSTLPAAEPADGFVLVENGKAETVIVTGKDVPYPVRFAAYELKKFLDRMSGGDFKIVHDKPESGNAIILGVNKYSKAAGVDISALKRDGYIVDIKKNTVFIAGKDDVAEASEILQDYMKDELGQTDPGRLTALYWSFERGTLNGTYRFLELLGVRFFAPGKAGTIVPEKKNVALNTACLVENPAFEERIGGYERITLAWVKHYAYNKKEADDLEWSGKKYRLWLLRNRYSTLKMAVNHNPALTFFKERFAKTHPEYFALLSNGKRAYVLSSKRYSLCYTNPGVLNEIKQDAAAFFSGKNAKSRNLRTNPISGKFNKGWLNGVAYGDTFSLLPNDGLAFCQCENCRKLVDNKLPRNQRQSKLIWEYVNKIAKELKKSFPDKKLSCLAYSAYTLPPDGMEKLPGNVVVGLCPSSLNKPYNLASEHNYRKYFELAKSWHDIAGGQPLLAWNHYLFRYFNRDKKGVPMVLPHLLSKYMKDLSKYAKWVMFEQDIDSLVMEDLNRYVMNRLLWNPELDIDALLDDYFTNMYGKAAPIMKEIFADVEMKSNGLASSRASMATIWDKFYPQAILDNYRKKVDEALKLTTGTQAHEQVELFSKYFLGTMEDAYRSYVKNFKNIVKVKDSFMVCAISPSAKIDGNIADRTWKSFASTRRYFFNNVDGAKTAEPTELKVAPGRKNLYLFFTCSEADIDRVFANPDKDVIEVFIDPEHDCQTYYWIMFNAKGKILNQTKYTLGGDQADHNWQSNAVAAAGKGKDAWRLEIAIPYKSLRVKPIYNYIGKSWGVNFCRTNSKPSRHKDRFSSLSPLCRGAFNAPDKFGSIIFRY